MEITYQILCQLRNGSGLGLPAHAIDTARAMPVDQLRPTIDPNALQGLKFSSCLPDNRGERILEERLREERGIQYLKDSPVRIVAMG